MDVGKHKGYMWKTVSNYCTEHGSNGKIDAV